MQVDRSSKQLDVQLSLKALTYLEIRSRATGRWTLGRPGDQAPLCPTGSVREGCWASGQGGMSTREGRVSKGARAEPRAEGSKRGFTVPSVGKTYLLFTSERF